MIAHYQSILVWSASVATALFLASGAGAEERAYHTLSLGTGNMNEGTSPSSSGLAIRYALNCDIKQHLFSPAVSAVIGHGSGKASGWGRSAAWDVGLLYGRRLTGKAGYLYAGAGVAYVSVTRWRWVLRSGEIERETDQAGRTVGVPWNVSAAVKLDQKLGLLFQVFGDINRENSFYGWGLGLHLGN